MRADECREMKIGDCPGGEGGDWLKLFAWLVQLPVVYQTIIYQAVLQEHLLSLWGLRLHYASLSIGRRGKQSQWLPLGRGASKAAAAAVACSKLFYERCKAFLIKTPLAQLMKVNNFHFPFSYFFPSKRRCRHMQCRQITFCVENNSLPFFSSPSLTGIKNNSSDKSRPSKKSIATVAALHNWAVRVGGGVCYCRGLLSRLVV